ncbi:hypothetical protein ACFXGA_32885 [Actinosynnema sp. NPDC059335]|uniref:hypothetical protein n=1 Tax=Actinosynnema sp. NPDC059335 TaxID=3346804 RepID=UPI0036734985
MSPTSRTAWLRGAAAGAAAVACAVVVAATPIAPPAHADPGICIDLVMEHGYEATDTVLKACKIAKTGKHDDRRKCRRMLVDEGVDSDVAKEACRIASEPDRRRVPA